MRLLPRSLGTRTAVALLAGLAIVQVAGLTIHALDRVELQRLAQLRDVGVRAMSLYRSVALTQPEERGAVVREADTHNGLVAKLDAQPPPPDLQPTAMNVMRQIRTSMGLVPLPQPQRPKEVVISGGPNYGRVEIGMRLGDGTWLHVRMLLPEPRPWHSRTFLLAFLLMTAAAAMLTIWAVRRLTAPVATLAAAAEALGRDVNAPPLPEDGPTEVAQAAAAFNLMAIRIRRFVQDRTFLLTAIGHDLRTPITRLKLRTEFIDDEEMRRKLLADIDELEAMVGATLAFGRDVTADEPVSTLDLAELARTVLDEAQDARPDLAGKMAYEGPAHLPGRARSLSLKRALTNLVANALKYGGAARLVLRRDSAVVTLLVDDDGPGIPAEELERVFQPFHRLEASRNRETGGTGLGLSIARNILRAHGGDVTLGNRAGGGARATVTLPA